MKRLLIVSTVLLAIACAAVAEDIKIEDLKTPPSPAFVLMGIAPSAVERPTTPRALGASLLSALNDSSNSSAPKNFALDVAPYWLRSHPKLSYKQYNQPGFGQALMQSLSISLAAKQQTAATATAPATTLGGVGVRASWLLGKPSEIEDQIRVAIEEAAVSEALKGGAATSGPLTAAPLISNPVNTKLIDAFRSARYEGRWFIEGAAASTALFTGNDAEQSTHQKSGFWLASSYRMNRTSFDTTTKTVTSQPNIDLVGVLRWISDHTGTVRTEPLDIGVRVVWSTAELEISAEHVERRKSSNNSARTAAVGEFKLSDTVSLTATFGKNFKDENPNGNLLAIFGVHFGVGSKPVVDTSK